jgi:glycine/D-amino acid oxidase-like deaminating enzyme/nitrite reductase/ring-hydroxylating ferredoxin subunit
MEAQIGTITARDGELQSAWQQASHNGEFGGQKRENLIYDCLVVGGGITGLTTALLLQQQGKKVILTEGHTTGFGTTGGTSAHINTFADTSYKDAESAFGEEGARLFADAINEACKLIKTNVECYNIDCDYEVKTGYIFAEDESQAKQLDDVYNGSVKVGIPVKYTDEVSVPIPYQKALEFANQAQFHPLKYISALAQEFIKAGGTLLENTFIDTVERDEDIHAAFAKDVRIKAKNVVYATHMPPGITNLNFRCGPYRSYVIGVELNDNAYPDALIYDMQEPYHYIRTHVIEGQPLLLVGGNDHKTGHDDPGKAFEYLEKYIRQYYNVKSVKYKWSSQYYVPADGFPYIGQIPEASAGIYCATGYNGNGMMLGTIAGKILSDLVSGKESRYQKVFSPARIKPIAGFTEFVKENADVAYHFVADRLTIPAADLQRIGPDTGMVIIANGEQVAAYRDTNGLLHTLSPVCTHAKCIVNWNQQEKSWDCPCHGARYDVDGNVLTGPATQGLQKIDTNE